MSQRWSHFRAGFLGFAPAASLFIVFTLLGAVTFAVDEFWPGARRPAVIDLLARMPWWGWIILALVAAWAVLFEGTFRQARRSTAVIQQRDETIAALEASLADARSAGRQRISASDADARVDLANLVTRVHRFATGLDAGPLDPAVIRDAGVLKDRLSHDPEIARLWTAFFHAHGLYLVQKTIRKGTPVTKETVRTAFMGETAETEAFTRAVSAFRDHLLMRSPPGS